MISNTKSAEMEPTQRLEPNMESAEKKHPDQIGFLGICGNKYPIKMGPNKIGRDPQTCNVVLNLNSISRQHAVLNVLNKTNFMLMDLDSANNTKLQDQILEPYIPQPLKNGDTVQFGDVFGIYRLLEEENDLPMTQNLVIPETPIVKKHMSKVNHTVVVPESPEVSDKDNSFICMSQTKAINYNSKTKVLKPSNITIQIQSNGEKNINNVYCNSLLKSDLVPFPSGLKNVIITSVASKYKEEQNTFEPDVQRGNVDNDHYETNISIYKANTQVTDENYNVKNDKSSVNKKLDLDPVIFENECDSNDAIFLANKQLPKDLHDLQTQVSQSLPNVFKLETNTNIELNLCAENENSDIFNAETQVFLNPKHENNNNSDDIIIFDEIDGNPVEEDFESQAILPPGATLDLIGYNLNNSSITNSEIHKPNKFQKNIHTHCDDFDILPMQISVNSPENNENAELQPNTMHTKQDINCANTEAATMNSVSTNLPLDKENVDKIVDEDLQATQIVSTIEDNTNCNFEEMLTQIITINSSGENENAELQSNSMLTKTTNKHTVSSNIPLDENNLEYNVDKKNDDDLEATQVVLSIEDNTNCNFEDMLTQVLPKPEKEAQLKRKTLKQVNTVNNFKVPKHSPRKIRKKNASNIIPTYHKNQSSSSNTSVVSDDDEQNFYAATQDILNDLCSQMNVATQHSHKNANKSMESGCDAKIIKKVSCLSSQEVRIVIGVDKVSKLQRFPSVSSDSEITPKKVFNIMNNDLPTSQEIKNSVAAQNKIAEIDSISESDSAKESEEGTPILFKKKKITSVSRINLLQKFDPDALPSRISTRIRRPTEKFVKCSKLANSSILKSPFIFDQEEDVDSDIVAENISRLKAGRSRKSCDSRDSKTEGKRGRKNSDTNVKKRETRNVDVMKKGKTVIPKDSKTKNELKSKEEKAEVAKGDKKLPTKRGRPKKLQTEEKQEAVAIQESKTQNRKTKEALKGILKSTTHSNTSKEIETSTKPNRRNQRGGNTMRSDDESIVYVSSFDTLGKKRKATTAVELLAKRHRPVTARGSSTNSRSTTSRRQITHYILFTAFPGAEVGDKLVRLGAVLAKDVKECTLVVTQTLKRTFKLLCAVGLGKPIVGWKWVNACLDSNAIVDPWHHLIQDEEIENRLNFNLERTLRSKRNYLKGYSISCTPSVLPNQLEMKLIVECSGGKWKELSSNAPKSNWLVVSSMADKHLWADIKEKGGIIVTNEIILEGVLTQTLNIKENQFN